MDNLAAVRHQMDAFGIKLRPRDDKILSALPGSRHEGKKTTCGEKGKDWFKFYIFRPDMGGEFITGSFGTYRHGGDWQKVEQDWAPLTQAERDRQARQRAEVAERSERERQAEIALARVSAGEHWQQAQREGVSPYLERKGLGGEACRYLAREMKLRWRGRDPGERDTIVQLPAGTVLVPMLRYDLEREEALRGLQFIRPDGAKIYLRGLEKTGAALRLGTVDATTRAIVVVEGYATGLTVREATRRTLPVFVAFDAGNLAHVVPLVADLYPDLRLLICADDDWKTTDKRTGKLSNPGRTAAKACAETVVGVDVVYPIFGPGRLEKDTDFDDLRTRDGIDAVRRQIMGVVQMMEKIYG